MKKLFFNSFLFISLLTTFCPSFGSESPQQTEIKIDKESFEALMNVARKQIREIGWCVQQILQTLCNNKEQYTIENKNDVIEALKIIQKLSQEIELEITSKNTHQALSQVSILNNGLIHLLSQGLASKFEEFDINTFIEKLHKRSHKDISDQDVVQLIDKNSIDLDALVTAIGTTGLTWYNLIHRKMKEYNIYDKIKKTVVIGVGVAFLATIYCASNRISPDGGYLDKYIGTTPIKNPITGKYEYETGCGEVSTAGSNDFLRTSPKPFTIFQSAVTTLKSLQEVGFAAIAPLVTVNLASISHYCFGDSYDWAKETVHENKKALDQFLHGSQPNKNINEDGQEKVYFADLVGCEELEELANQLADFVQHPEYYERSKTETHRGILLYGPPQTGKSNFAKALRTRIQERLEASGGSKKMGFIDGKGLLDRRWQIEEIFALAEYLAPCILFLDEIDLIAGNREKDPLCTGKLLTCMQGLDISSKQIIVIGATNRVEQLDKALLVDGRFGKQYFIDYPEYKYRKKFLESELAKRAIMLSDEFIDRMAQETDGCNCSYNNLRRIITEAIIISVNEHRLVCEADFEKTLDIEIKKIYFGSRAQATDEEKNIIATYQAGKALVRHLLCTDKQITKVTIENVARTVKSKKTGFAFSLGEDANVDNEKLAAEKNESKIKLGEVFTISKNNKQDLISDEEIKKECLVLLAGNIAQQILLGQSYSNCNKHDRADAMQIIYQSIAQGDKIDDKIRAQALVVKEAYQQELCKLLENNKELLIKIKDALTQEITLNHTRWAELIG